MQGTRYNLTRGLLPVLLLAGFVLTPTAEARWLSVGEAQTAAGATGWTSGLEADRLASDLIQLRGESVSESEWVGECPFPSCDGGTCQWSETQTTTITLWVRELANGYRVRDDLGGLVTVKAPARAEQKALRLRDH
jgi:hypothetical protein